MTGKERAPPEFAAELVRRVSVEVYKVRLNDGNQPSADGTTAVERMLAKDADDGSKLATRAASYDALTRSYLQTFAALGWFNQEVGKWVF